MIAALWLAAPGWAGTWKICVDVTTTFGGVPNPYSWEDYLPDHGPYLEIADRAEPGTWDGSTLTPAFLQSPAVRLTNAAQEFDDAHGTDIADAFIALQYEHGLLR